MPPARSQFRSCQLSFLNRDTTAVAGGRLFVGDFFISRRALGQLLDNACKYSPLGSVISLHVSESNGLTEIRVSNSGSAIPLQEQRRIFDRFYRGSTAVQMPGSGLGLYVARKIALAHGGTLDLAPEKLTNDEVSFCLTIPSLKGETDHVVTAT